MSRKCLYKGDGVIHFGGETSAKKTCGVLCDETYVLDAMVLSSLTSYVLKKGGRPPSKQAAYGMLVGLFVLNIAYVSMKATLESKKEEEEKILDARERLMSGRGLRGEVLYFDDEKTWDKRRRRRSTEEEEEDKEEG